MAENRLPENPLAFIKRRILEKRVLWTYHINMRMNETGITRDMILDSVPSYEIIESYPDDKYFPSYLVHAKHRNTIFHVLFAADVKENNIHVVTAYCPDSAKWDIDLKRRNKT